jgi:hypothetical protein
MLSLVRRDRRLLEFLAFFLKNFTFRTHAQTSLINDHSDENVFTGEGGAKVKRWDEHKKAITELR